MKWMTSASVTLRVNPELLDELAKRFTDYNYDFKKLVRDICTSRTYQLATQTNPSNENDLTNFSHGTSTSSAC